MREWRRFRAGKFVTAYPLGLHCLPFFLQPYLGVTLRIQSSPFSRNGLLVSGPDLGVIILPIKPFFLALKNHLIFPRQRWHVTDRTDEESEMVPQNPATEMQGLAGCG
jgi:hypothetical protein